MIPCNGQFSLYLYTSFHFNSTFPHDTCSQSQLGQIENLFDEFERTI